MNRPTGQTPAVRATGQIPVISDELLAELPFPPAPIQDMLRLFVKAVRAHQMYLPNNPVYRSAVDAVRASFTPIWQQTQELALTFSETEIRWEGAPVLAEPAKAADSLPWTFFKDGIREVRIAPGFEDDELARMFDILQRARKAAPNEDDLLTMLWEADFSRLRYRYVELGAESVAPLEDGAPEGNGGGRGPASADDVRAAVQQAVDAHQAGDAAGAEARPGVVDMRDFDATLHFLEESELDYLRQEIAREYADDLRTNVLSALLDIFETQRAPEVRAEVCELIESMMLLMLAAGELRAVAHLLAEAGVAVTRGADVTAEQKDRLGRLPERLSAPEPLGQMLQALDEAADQPPADELALLFGELHPDALGTIFAWLPRLRNDAVRVLVEQAAERLAIGHSDELVRLIQSKDEAVACEAVRRAASMKLATAVPAMSRVLPDASASTRLSLVQALAAIGNTSAMTALERCMDDEDREVRVAAVKALGAKKHRSVLARLEERLKGRALQKADLTERMAFFEAYGLLCGDAGVEYLDGLLNGKGMFGHREDPELRACAAIALGKIGTAAARGALQRSTGEKDVVVRSAVGRALRGGSE